MHTKQNLNNAMHLLNHVEHKTFNAFCLFNQSILFIQSKHQQSNSTLCVLQRMLIKTQISMSVLKSSNTQNK